MAEISDSEWIDLVLIVDPPFRNVLVRFREKVRIISDDRIEPGHHGPGRYVVPSDDCIMGKNSDHVCNGGVHTEALLQAGSEVAHLTNVLSCHVFVPEAQDFLAKFFLFVRIPCQCINLGGNILTNH